MRLVGRELNAARSKRCGTLDDIGLAYLRRPVSPAAATTRR